MTDAPDIPLELTEAEREKHERLIATATGDIALAREKAAEPDAEEKAKQARRLAGTPVGFAKLVLGVDLYGWQAKVLSWFENTLKRVKGSLCTPNGAGKSERIVATLALWWISVHPQGMVVITTKDSKQLDNQIWPAIERHKGKFPGFDFIERMVRNRQGGFIIGFTTDDPGRAEGWHKINDFTGPLLIIGDEAKSIADGIHMALDRCTYNAKLLTSSPGLTEGIFYRTQTEPGMGYKTMQIGLTDCPHIPKERIDDIIATYGPDHWFTRSTLYGEFTDADSDTLFVIPKHIVRTVMDMSRDGQIRYQPGGKRASCDFAAGRAENVFTLKHGNRITQVCWKDVDPMRAVAQFVALFNEHGLLPSEIYGDAGGMGIAILARFAELGWPINPVNNESAPLDPIRYPNLGAEMWHNAAPKLGRFDLILPDDPVLFAQLTGRRAAPTSDAILGLESKRDMQKRNAPSPDRADGLVMVLAAETELANTLFDGEGLAKLESAARAKGQGELGSLQLGTDRVVYEKRSDGFLSVYERPIIGRSYISVLNPHRHDEQLKNHSLIMVKAPFWDEKEEKFEPAALVARVRLVPFRLDARPLANMVTKLAKWYGNAIIVPIVNDRGDIIERLVEAGAHLYSREEFELQRSGRKRQFEYGWESDDYTQSLWIGALSEKIREDEVVVQDVNTVMQLYQLNPKLPSAMRDAEALGVGLQLIAHATTYVAPRSARTESGAHASMFG